MSAGPSDFLFLGADFKYSYLLTYLPCWEWWRAIDLVDDLQEDGLTTSQTGADVHYQLRLFNWRLTVRSGEELLASTAHRGHEF